MGTLKVFPKLYGKVRTRTLVLFLSFSETKYDSTHQSQSNAVDLKDADEMGEGGMVTPPPLTDEGYFPSYTGLSIITVCVLGHLSACRNTSLC